MRSFLIFVLTLLPGFAFASASAEGSGFNLDMTTHFMGFLALGIFVVAYSVVMAEEFIHLRKSKPVILAAGAIWIIVAILAKNSPEGSHHLEEVLQHNLVKIFPFQYDQF